MITYNKKDVVLISFPFSDLSSTKKRPVVILATVRHRQELICMMLTSTKVLDSNVDIPIQGLQEAGLPKPTVARTSRLFTVTNDIVIKKIGELENSDFNKLITKVIDILEAKEI